MEVQEFFGLKEDDTPTPEENRDELPPWRILIVDDDEQVHRVTRFALRGQRILGRKLEFESAYSAAEARALLARNRYSLILLDVVMETADAGLKLVGEIRERFEDPAVRIILRTGQPGYAPELEVIQNYDINDYRAKSELTTERLVTSLTAGLRTYQQICTIEEDRRRLEQLLHASSELLRLRSIRELANGVLRQICSILEVPPQGVLCVSEGEGLPLRLLGALHPPGVEAKKTVLSPQREARIRRVLAERRDDFGEDYVCLCLEPPSLPPFAVDVPVTRRISGFTQRLIALYAIQVMVGFDNAHLFEELEHYAFFDPLTGLPNRSLFERQLSEQLLAGSRVEVLLVDIDNFQAINDGLGHAVGNRTLQTMGELLREAFSKAPSLARLSADTFAVAAVQDEVISLGIETLRSRLRDNLEVYGHRFPVSVTFGSAVSEPGEDAATLLRHAGIALKRAKRRSRSAFERFDRRYEDELDLRLKLVSQLRQALAEGRFQLVFQPQRRLADGQLVGFEALLRWQRDSTSLVSASEFIEAAEESGQIVPIGTFVLEEACRWQQALARKGFDLPVSVNVSPRQLEDPSFYDRVLGALELSQTPAERLELEVTESLLLNRGATDVFAALRARGVRIAVDDFGIGQSSLSRLRELPIERLKIDRAFISELDVREESRVICELIVRLGHALGLRVIAEGVERKSQDQLLRDFGCDEVQGFLYGYPMTFDEVERELPQ
jgi:diguanylate cyclase (GGDEF)-like protein